jgi:hypothetical protein
MVKFRRRLRYIYSTYFSESEQESIEFSVDRTSFWTNPFMFFVQVLACAAGTVVAIVIIDY